MISTKQIRNFAGIDSFNPNLYLDANWLGNSIRSGNFEPHTTKFIVDYLHNHPECVCVDAGANIGYYTIIMARLAEMVYAFEPSRKYFEILIKNCESNNLIDKCVLSNKGLSDTSLASHPMYIFDQSASFYLTDDVQYQSEEVTLITLDEAVDKKIGLIKIDCDGHDPMVIYGGSAIINEYSPVIVVEVAPHCYRKAGVDVEQFYWYIDGLDYRMYSEYDIHDRLDLAKYMSYAHRKDICSFNMICMRD